MAVCHEIQGVSGRGGLEMITHEVERPVLSVSVVYLHLILLHGGICIVPFPPCILLITHHSVGGGRCKRGR